MHTLGSLADAMTPTRAALRDLPPGFETASTLRYMRQMVHHSLTSNRQTIREQAIAIIRNAGVAERDWWNEAAALQGWVRDNVRFMRDPEDYELVQTPEKTLEYRTGDCDDKSTLLAALLTASGHPAQFIAIGFDGGPFSHVLVRTKIGDTWIPAETILSVPLGWWPPNVTSNYILKI